jgi:hypothetical protein
MKEMKSFNYIRILFILFLILAFLLGAYVYSCVDMKKMIYKMEGMKNIELENFSPEKDTNTNKQSNEELCPDILVKRDGKYYLSNSKRPDESPKVFDNLEKYKEYMKSLEGKACPVLYVQEEFNTQGQSEMRVRPNPFDPQYGLPITSSVMKPIDRTPVKVGDASRDNPQYNQNMYAGFDPYGQYNGIYTELDALHDSTAKDQVSENPMDPNWGGVIYTQQAINSGKYDGNKVESTNYVATTPKGGQVIQLPNKSLPQG